ncbi:MAG TPA: methionine adenosyltransferase, partial [Vicinamibacterales bacterium]|nr:methionine adenosyltransferase [Vicinamibacterales bacterium]
LEAAAGKNPASHVGKLYNLAASRISGTIAASIPHVSSAECVLVSQIGRLASDPRIVDVCLAGEERMSAATVRNAVSQIVRSELEALADLRDALVEERIQVY